jgi:RNA:NAD 2'-phosphotransferase (TPT1/KptA family)
MPHIPLLLEEMSELKIINDKKVDHPRKKSKDLSDAVTGAVFGALSHTPKNTNIEIEIHTWSSSSSQVAKAQQSVVELDSQKIPENVRDYLDQFKLI